MTDAAPSNPYAAPSADLGVSAPEPAPGHAASFYAMSPTKLVIMSWLTGGIYDLCFWWRQWGARRRAGEDVSVFWRTFFAPYTCFGFTKSVILARHMRDLGPSSLLGIAPSAYLVANLIELGINRVQDPGFQTFALISSVLANLVRASMLGAIQHAINELLNAEGYRGPYNRGVTAGAVVVGLLGIAIWGAALLGVIVPAEPSVP